MKVRRNKTTRKRVRSHKACSKRVRSYKTWENIEEICKTEKSSKLYLIDLEVQNLVELVVKRLGIDINTVVELVVS